MIKNYILYAGVNGSGKSTLYHTRAEFQDLPRINTDEILAEFGDWRNQADLLKAGKIAVGRIKQLFMDEQSFVQETTLCGRGIVQNIINAKKHGYKITVFYVGVDSVELAKERIAYRVKKGGHGIPDADVERRFHESFRNLEIIMPYCDELYFFDNTEYIYPIAAIKGGEKEIISKKLPDWFLKILC